MNWGSSIRGLFLRAEDGGGEFLEACNCNVGPGLCRFDGPDAWACGRAVHPHRRETESLRWNNVVIDALAYMQDAMGGRRYAAEGQLKKLERRFVRPRLLRGDDFIKSDFELRSGAFEQIVVDVGEDGEAESRFQLAQGGDGIWPWFPGRKRFCERMDFFGSGNESQLSPELATDGAQNLAIGPEGRLLCLLLEVSVKLEEGSVPDVFGMRRKDAVKRREQPGLPVDEGSIAIEGEDLEAVEIEHRAIISDCPMRKT